MSLKKPQRTRVPRVMLVHPAHIKPGSFEKHVRTVEWPDFLKGRWAELSEIEVLVMLPEPLGCGGNTDLQDAADGVRTFLGRERIAFFLVQGAGYKFSQRRDASTRECEADTRELIWLWSSFVSSVIGQTVRFDFMTPQFPADELEPVGHPRILRPWLDRHKPTNKITHELWPDRPALKALAKWGPEDIVAATGIARNSQIFLLPWSPGASWQFGRDDLKSLLQISQEPKVENQVGKQGIKRLKAPDDDLIRSARYDFLAEGGTLIATVYKGYMFLEFHKRRSRSWIPPALIRFLQVLAHDRKGTDSFEMSYENLARRVMGASQRDYTSRKATWYERLRKSNYRLQKFLEEVKVPQDSLPKPHGSQCIEIPASFPKIEIRSGSVIGGQLISRVEDLPEALNLET